MHDSGSCLYESIKPADIQRTLKICFGRFSRPCTRTIATDVNLEPDLSVETTLTTTRLATSTAAGKTTTN